MGTYTKMKSFVTVIQENSFNQAAKKLATSAAEISRRISALEEELKVKLINRTTRKLTLTQLGEIYYEDCKNIIKDVESANQKMISQQQEPSGILSIIVSDNIFPIINEFTKRYPKIILKLNKIESLPDFNQQETDIIIGLSESSIIPEDCVRKLISKTRYVLCCSPEYLAQTKAIKKPLDLNHHRYIAHSNRPSADIIFFKKELSIHVTPSFYLNDSQEMVKAALNHLGLIWVHDYKVKEYLSNKQLIEVLSEYALPEVNRYLVYKYNRYLESKIRAFVDFYIEKSV